MRLGDQSVTSPSGRKVMSGTLPGVQVTENGASGGVLVSISVKVCPSVGVAVVADRIAEARHAACAAGVAGVGDEHAGVDGAV
jgi:hypothetical protein